MKAQIRIGNSIPFSPQAFGEIKKKMETNAKPKARTYTREEARRVTDEIVRLMDLRVGVVNAISAYVMTDAKGYLEKTPYWGLIKDNVTKSLAWYRRYEEYKRRQAYRYKGFALWADTIDGVYDKAQDSIRMIQMQIMQQATRHGIAEANAWAWAETAYTIIRHACLFYDTMCADIKVTYGVDVAKEFADHRMSKVMFLWGHVMKTIHNQDPEEVDINLRDDVNYKNAFTIYRNLVEREDTFVDAAIASLETNKEYVSDVDYANIRKIKDERDAERLREKQRCREYEEKYRNWGKPKAASADDLEKLKDKFNTKAI